MRILITGVGGFVGSYLAEAELDAGNQVIGIDIASTGKVNHILGRDGFSYVQRDIMDDGVVERYMMDCDMVYHLAAIADPQVYCEHPVKVLRLDLEGTQLVIKLAHKYSKKIVFASTSEVYGKNPNVPWTEESDRVLGSTIKPRWSYSSSKAIGEHYCYAYGMEGLKFSIVRFFNFYGPRLDFIGKGRVMTCFLENFLKGEPVRVCAPGTQSRCFTYISDGIDGIMKAARYPENTSFNFGVNVETTMLSLAKQMKIIGGFKSDIIVIPAEAKYGPGYDDIPRRVPDCTKAKTLLGWEPKIGLEEGLRRTIESYRCA
jgi:UDP-glucose 4-epimerase